MNKKISERKNINILNTSNLLNHPMCFYSLDFYVLFRKSSTEQKIKVLNYSLHILITSQVATLLDSAGAKSQYRRFISRQKTYNGNSNKNVEVQIQEIQSKTGKYYQIGGAIWKPGGTIWSLVQLAPRDYLGWPNTQKYANNATKLKGKWFSNLW